MVALDMLKLAELPQQQMEKVVNSAAKYGCLYGMNSRDVEKLKSKVPKSKENIRQSLQIKNDT
jgi:3-dehydroquinate synthetase